MDMGSKTCPFISEFRDVGRGIGKGDLSLVASSSAVISIYSSLFPANLVPKPGSITTNMFLKVSVLSVSSRTISNGVRKFGT